MDPDQPVPCQGDGAFLADFPAAAIDALLAVAGPDADTLLASVELRHLGGALARPAPGGGAQPSIDANYLLFAGAATPTPDLAAAVRAQAQAVKDALAPWHAGYDYYNFEETPATARAVLPPASYRRLQEIKAAYDPGQAIISAHPVWPARVRASAWRCCRRCWLGQALMELRRRVPAHPGLRSMAGRPLMKLAKARHSHE